MIFIDGLIEINSSVTFTGLLQTRTQAGGVQSQVIVRVCRQWDMKTVPCSHAADISSSVCGLTRAHLLLNVQQVCNLTQALSPIWAWLGAG